MKIIVGFEESQAVTIELRKLGHEAYSCDLLPCSGGHPEWHIQGDAVVEAYSGKYDAGIFFPPCTDLAVSGARWFKEKIANGNQQKSIDLFMKIANCPIPKTAMENPVGIMSSLYRKPDQIIQPWMFGDLATKTTCLWLKGFNKLVPDVKEKPELEYVYGKDGKYRMQKWMYDIRCKSTKNGERASLASKTFPGIAKAMAKQFTENNQIQPSLFNEIV